MKRLTVRVPESEETYLSCEKCGKKSFSECWDEMDCEKTVIDRLAAIEDILGDDYDLDRLWELVEADRMKKAKRKMNGRKTHGQTCVA